MAINEKLFYLIYITITFFLQFHSNLKIINHKHSVSYLISSIRFFNLYNNNFYQRCVNLNGDDISPTRDLNWVDITQKVKRNID
ncbi:unnamed protein product [Cunninghamella echinulata]